MRSFVRTVEAHALVDRDYRVALARAEQADLALGAAQTRLSEATDRHSVAQQRLRTGVVQAYMNGWSAPTDPSLGLVGLPVDTGDTATVYAQQLLGELRVAYQAAVADLDAADAAHSDATDEQRDAALARDAITPLWTSTRAALAGGQDSARAVAASVGVPVRAVFDPTPAVMGDPVITEDEMVGWYRAQGYVNNTGVSDTELIATYWEEGRTEGVRPDLAFLQSVVETAGFAYMSSPNNFAGIGHCDSCDRGFLYGTVRVGVRAQIQYLKAYATEGFTARDLANPLVPRQLESLGVRGCCTTWYGLTGTWATAIHYGGTILGLYEDVLARRTGGTS